MTDFFDNSIALKLKPFKRGTANILRELSDEKVLNEDFLLDPAGFLAARLHPRVAANASRARLNSANRFLFSIMSNGEFTKWLADYQQEALNRFEKEPLSTIDKNKLRYDLAAAMAKFGDPDIINAALLGNVSQIPDFDPEIVFDVIGTIEGHPPIPKDFVQNLVTKVVFSQVVTAEGWGPGRMADVAVEIETLIYAVAAAAVFAVVVAVVVIGAMERIGERNVLRDTALSIRDMSAIAEALTVRGQQLRKMR